MKREAPFIVGSRPRRYVVELQPFSVPNYVIQVVPPGQRQDGFREAPKYRLSEIDADTLAEMCDDFRRAVFEKAGITAPPRRNE